MSRKVSPAVLPGVLSHYPLQAPCVMCGHQDQGPLAGVDGCCLVCCAVARVKSEAAVKHAKSLAAASSGGERAVEPAKAAPQPGGNGGLFSDGQGPSRSGDRTPGGLPFTLYRPYRDDVTGRVSAAPVGPL